MYLVTSVAAAIVISAAMLYEFIHSRNAQQPYQLRIGWHDNNRNPMHLCKLVDGIWSGVEDPCARVQVDAGEYNWPTWRGKCKWGETWIDKDSSLLNSPVPCENVPGFHLILMPERFEIWQVFTERRYI